MSHINVELHENYMHEKISDMEHGIVQEEMEAIGFFRLAAQHGIVRHLPRASYFNVEGTVEDANRVWLNLERRLGRSVSMELTLGSSYGFGLRTIVKPTAPLNSLMASPSTLPRLNGIAHFLSTTNETPYGSLFGFVGEPK